MDELGWCQGYFFAPANAGVKAKRLGEKFGWE